ncbi:MAG: FKBP-type peptidyl-prolyl cis-trans isomerase [Verrucomicrobiales bacterium]|nr:FKBP-type peptidyl-prolyl cis-trans isomerase [Verrucomicrobiales bacterium]MCP5527791.1 FKBP-type peptidyl-prolyl cis-trans isomerase [Verrucomicrobiales bacterium]
MKHYLVAVIALGLCASTGLGQEKVELTGPKQRVSYSIGYDLGGNFKKQGIEVEPKALAAGIADALAGREQLTEAERREVLAELQKDLAARLQAKSAAEAEDNLKAGEAFLAANAKKPGVVVLPSGLQYKVLNAGAGRTPKATDKVKTHYHGTLIDGTVFDSSVERGEPVSFPVNGVIAGWAEALQLMKEGAKWQLFVPAKMAYGNRSAGPTIGPNSTLIFEVELLSIETP